MGVSIPDGDSFLREASPNRIGQATMQCVSIPDGDSFLREALAFSHFVAPRDVSIPDGDSFLREVPTLK